MDEMRVMKERKIKAKQRNQLERVSPVWKEVYDLLPQVSYLVEWKGSIGKKAITKQVWFHSDPKWMKKD